MQNEEEGRSSAGIRVSGNVKNGLVFGNTIKGFKDGVVVEEKDGAAPENITVGLNSISARSTPEAAKSVWWKETTGQIVSGVIVALIIIFLSWLGWKA